MNNVKGSGFIKECAENISKALEGDIKLQELCRSAIDKATKDFWLRYGKK